MRRFVNDKTEDILMTSSEGDLIRTVSVRIKGSNAYSYYFKGLISEKLCWSTYYADQYFPVMLEISRAKSFPYKFACAL